ncbi:MAG TPA: 16S rRNA (cytidine(1402)-2'-O)-methyltransferase, partial [Saprospiraceae bacterium]|nr:16S rRNA (cytidine(1402)-2'-O)-methyltransferase [Saprospiraceae bacterium]
MLYLVPTPIGNLKDITLRAIEVLQECDIVLAEDTRTTKKLFTHYNISTPLRAYHAHNEHKIVEEIINLLAGETSIALVTDAGTPAISDPGYLLVRACHDNG